MDRAAGGRLEAAVFDLDGVITLSAELHAAAWKQLFDAYLRARAERRGEEFRPFEESDYRKYVDGRPRYEGVRTFLQSRGITLPDGDPSDPPDAETLIGLGNRKNELFREQVERRGVAVDEGAVALVRELRRRGVPVGLASSSKNVDLLLARAGLQGLFDAQVDGVVSQRLGLRGKPDPDIFLECLRRLDVRRPDDALIVEDAEAGVQAGRAGGFGLVIGVDRSERAADAVEWLALREHGAHWIVREMAEVTADGIERYLENRRHLRPNALAARAELEPLLAGARLALFLDYDGTLTPIVGRPEQAVLADDVRAALREAADAWPTTIVSGRGLEDVRNLVGLDDLHYAASHGFDIVGPNGMRHEVDPGLPPEVKAAADALEERVGSIPGALVEDKRYAVAVHYRQVPEDRVAEMEAAVDDVVARSPKLEKAGGKKVFELRPAMEWDKGRAVLWLIDALGLDGPDLLPIYIGDDVTDEDAFRALNRRDRGLGILVTELPRPTEAAYSLQNVLEVRELLRRLARIPAEREP